MSISAVALKRTRFTVVAAILVVVAGLASLLSFPSTEEPTVPFRTAVVAAQFPGASSERVEQLVARPLEERVRQLAEVKTVETLIRPGSATLYVTLHPETAPGRVSGVWQRLRAKVDDARPGLPAGVIGPVVNDDFGRVAVLSLALTGDGYSAGQLQDAARKLRIRLQKVEGVEQASLHGVQEERVYVELSAAKLVQTGLDPRIVVQALAARNVVAPSGVVETGGRMLPLETTGDLPDAATLSRVPVPLPGGGSVALGAIARVTQGPADPPETAAIYNGRRAIVFGVSMRQGLNVIDVVSRLRTEAEAARADLPVGMKLDVVTDQSEVVGKELKKVGQIFVETVLVVMAVVVLFLGWRAGLATGLIVPLTVAGTLLGMRALGIELHTVSIAAIIISLGIFVDNAIVIVEDYQRRLADGETRRDAAEAAGRTMATPLLVSSLAIIFAFAPLVMGASESGEYMRSLAIVIAATLLISLFLALTVTVVAAQAVAGHADHEKEERGVIARVRRWYAGAVRRILDHPRAVVGAMAGLLAIALVASAALPSELFSPSSRNQLQIGVELAPGSSSRETYAVARALSARLADRKLYPDVTGNATYVGDGGPRFILGLNPQAAAPHLAYVVVNLDHDADRAAVLARLRNDLSARFPSARITPKTFSLGVSEAGVAVFRLVGDDRGALLKAAARLKADLAAVPGMRDVKDDAEGQITRLVVDVDQARALAAGVTSEAVAASLDAAYSGQVATVLRQGDVLVPVVMRAPAGERTAPERLDSVPVMGALGPVPLAQVASVRISDQPSILMRRNEQAVVTVTARHATLKAQGIVDAARPAIDRLDLPAGNAVQIGGEIEESVDANKGLVTYFPMAVVAMAGLFLWQFGSVRKTIIILASMPFVLIGATLGLFATGQPLSYSATLGLLALAGIIVNNAVLLLERIAEEKAAGKSHVEAVADAAAVRLRPIVMTKLTCVAGLLPLYLFGGDLWRPMAAAMIGGLALGTLITLVLIPALYTLLFSRSGSPAARSPETPAAAA